MKNFNFSTKSLSFLPSTILAYGWGWDGGVERQGDAVPLPSSRVQWGDHRLGRRGALPQLARAVRPWAGLHLGRACGGRQAHHAGRPSVSARWALSSHLPGSGALCQPARPA